MFESPATDLNERGLPAKLAGAVYGTVLGILFGIPLGYQLGVRGIPLILFAVMSVFAAGYTIYRITHAVPEGAARALLRFTFPSGNSTPYQPTYSHLQAFAARGDISSAHAGYQEAIRLNPTDPEPRFQLAELLMQDSKPAKAAWYLGQARRLSTNNPARELYATQRMIDLYLGPLDDPNRAMMELKRLIDRFPDSREAQSARAVLKELRSA
jgi:thioredoxin-like negative regulator of GroEL